MKNLLQGVFIRRTHLSKDLARRGLMMLIALITIAAVAMPVSAASAHPTLTFTITAVVMDTSVTIQANSFPANQDFTVRMGAYGTMAVGGTVVGTTNSEADGSFSATYTIPDALKGSQALAIRMDTADGLYYAYNWFYNNPNAPQPASTYPGNQGQYYPYGCQYYGCQWGYQYPYIPGYYGYPTFSITSVEQNSKVTIHTSNLPPDQTVDVRMNYYGTLGVAGVVVNTFESGTGGSQDLTFDIPDFLKSYQQIAIRLECESGYYAYNWFWNNTAPWNGSVSPDGYVGIPTFAIIGVVRDSTVTIKTNNLPANQTFTVRMNYFGTNGVGGVVVATTESGNGGVMDLTYNIPDYLKGQSQIAVRLESQTGYYFAYNWFWNNSTN